MSRLALSGRIHRTTALLVGALFFAGVIVRVIVLRSTASVLNADEAYTGIQSFEILRGRIPIVLGGTSYTLPFESYVYAPFVAVFGSSITSLKVLPAIWWLIASIVGWFVGRRLGGERVAWLTAAFLWLTPGALLLLSVTAYESYSSGMLVTLLACLLALRLLDSRDEEATDPSLREAAAFGALCGLAFWMHPMFLATTVPMVLVVLVVHRRQVRTLVAVIGGGIVGCSPLLLWNAVNGWPSLEAPIEVPGTYTGRLQGFFRELLPRGLGLRDQFMIWHPNRLIGLLLYGVFLALVVVGVVTMVRRSNASSRWLVPAVLLGVFPIMAVFQNLAYTIDGRYAVISFPFLVIAVAVGIDRLAAIRPNITVAVVAVTIPLWVLAFTLPTIRPLWSATGDPNAYLGEITAMLDDAGIEHVYGSYWLALPVDFAGDRALQSGVLYPLPIRFPIRQRAVEAAPHDRIAFVFFAGEDDPSRLFLPVEEYERRVVGPAVVYLPVAALGTTSG